MTMTPRLAAERITEQLGDAERQLDCLIAAQANLTSLVMQASIDVSGHSVDVQPVLLRLAKAQEGLIAARGEMLRAHGLMRDIGRERGDYLTGDCPDQSKGYAGPRLAAAA